LFDLKEYQKFTIEKLEKFLEKARLFTKPQAFAEEQNAAGYSSTYTPISGLEDIPYVCLRLPTGGGKTLLASHTISVVTKSYLEKEYPIVLWLVPTDIIRKQTMEVLKDPKHPNRIVLDLYFKGNVRIYDIADYAQLRPHDIDSSVNIFVATFASFRVKSQDDRKVYAHNENLESHFSRIPIEEYFEKDENGRPLYSFANLLAYLRPIVIIDEAHNNTSDLSIEVLQRIRPSVIVEFTATPAKNSNVLFKVSASELKAEDMIKLPIRLIEHSTWTDAISTAIQTRQNLEEQAKNEPSYIRPIVLFQAENVNKEVTVDVVRSYLVDQEGIPENQIAVATGNQRELDGINLFDRSCPIRFVITVQALKEGWDCSFAYVFCSLARVQSSKDAEQLLGRVLRMPYAKRCMQSDLNKAYANVAISTWHEAVAKIRDNMIGMGFENTEADSNIQYEQREIEGLPLSEDPEIMVFHVESLPKIESLNSSLQLSISTTSKTEGGYEVTIRNPSKNDLEELIQKAPEVFSHELDKNTLLKYVFHFPTYSRPKTPSENGELFSVPQMCLDFGEGPEIAEKELFLPTGVDLLKYPLQFDDFHINPESHAYEFDIAGAHISERELGYQEQLEIGFSTQWTEVQLIDWLGGELRQNDILPARMTEYLRRVLEHLQTEKGAKFADLVRLRYLLEKMLIEKIQKLKARAYAQGIQLAIDGAGPTVRVESNVSICFREGCYPAKSFYRGRVKFSKHFFPCVGDMNPEEVSCAQMIDAHPNVETWVRNVECYPQYSFSIPTSTDRFYPDFVAKLIDGRIVVIEYKGDIYLTTDDTKEKNMLGQLWERSSNGRCKFKLASMKNPIKDLRRLSDDIGKFLE